MNVGMQAGPQGPFPTGTVNQQLRGGQLGDLVVSELQARYYEQTYRKNIFSAYCAAQATSVVGTAMVGLQLTNNSSTVNLVLLKCAGNIIVTSSTTTQIVLAAGTGQTSAPTSQTAATRAGSNFISGPTPQGLATSLATFTNAPVAVWPLLHNTAAIATVGEDSGWLIDFEGAFIVPPNTYVAIAAGGAAVAAGGMDVGLMWTEVPV